VTTREVEAWLRKRIVWAIEHEDQVTGDGLSRIVDAASRMLALDEMRRARGARPDVAAMNEINFELDGIGMRLP